MKVILINPRFATAAQPPLGLAYLSAYLKETTGIKDVSIIDTSWQSLESGLSGISPPDIVGIHVMSPYHKRAEWVIGLIRKRFPKTKVIIGGPHINSVPEHLLRLEADFGVFGEGEVTFGEMVHNLADGRSLDSVQGVSRRGPDGTWAKNETRELIDDLDKLPFPDRAALPMSQYLRPGIMQEFGFSSLQATTILTSRGCPYRCAFCNHAMGRRIRYRSPENIVTEIEMLIKDYNINGIFCVDDTFTHHRRRLFAFSDLMQKRGIKIKMALNSRVDIITPELLQALKAAGVVSIAFGVESGNQEILDKLRKDIKIEQVEAAVRLTKECGIHVKGYFMIGVPGDSLETMSQTVVLAKRLPFDQVQFSIAIPYPGTEMWEEAHRLKLVDAPELMYSRGFTEGGVMRTEHLSSEEIRRFFQQTCRPLEYRRILAGILKDWRSIPHFVSYLYSRRTRKALERKIHSGEVEAGLV